jgi:signal peptidase I
VNFALILLILLLVSGASGRRTPSFCASAAPADAKDPWWVEYGASFFPVILVVFVLRSFLVEPFKIPSGSMIPTLQVGDFILVNKYTYGIRLPVANWKIIDINSPQRGDVMVFRYPEDPSLDYIKRVVGLPGDRVAYQNKRLTINGRAGGDDTRSTTICTRNGCTIREQFVEKLDGPSIERSTTPMPRLMSRGRRSSRIARIVPTIARA